jgi:hypothetical protein
VQAHCCKGFLQVDGRRVKFLSRWSGTRNRACGSIFRLAVLGSTANWRGEEPGDIVPRAVSGELLRTSQAPWHRQHSMPPDLIVHPLARTRNCSVSPLHCMQRSPCSLSHYHSRWPFARSLLLSLVSSIVVCLYSVCRCAFPTFTVPLLYLSHHHCVALLKPILIVLSPLCTPALYPRTVLSTLCTLDPVHSRLYVLSTPCTLVSLHSRLPVLSTLYTLALYSRVALSILCTVLSSLYNRGSLSPALCSRTALSHCTFALYPRLSVLSTLCTLDSLYSCLCLSHCTLDSVDSLYPHLCTLSHSALIVHSALARSLCTLVSVLSRCTLNSVHCTLVSLQSRLSVSRTMLSTLYSGLYTLDFVLSTLCFQSHVIVLPVPRLNQIGDKIYFQWGRIVNSLKPRGCCL